MDAILDTTEVDAGQATDVQADTQTVDTTVTQPVQETEAPLDARKFGPEFNQAVKAFRESNPQYSKQIDALRDSYGRITAINGLAPNGVKDITAWKALNDSLGGAQKLPEILERLNSYDRMQQLESKLKSGDASVFEADEYKESVAKLAPAMMQRFATQDATAFQEAVSPHYAAALAGTGLGNFIKGMYAQAGDNEPMKQSIAQLEDWFKRNSATQSLPAQQGGKPSEAETLRQQLREMERTTQEKESERVWQSDVMAPVEKYEKESIDKAIAPYVTANKMSDARKAKFVAAVNTSLDRAVTEQNDPEFAKTLKAYRANRTLQSSGAVTFMKNKLDSILPQIVADEAEYLGVSAPTTQATQPVQATTQTQQASSGVIATRLAERPDPATLDLKRTPDAMLFKNQAYTKEGKLVTWPSKRAV